MFITSREKAIIELIIKTSGKHTAFSIGTFLNVSVRTIQRDLKAVEKILEQYHLRLERNTNDGLIIEGKNEQIFRLVQQLTSSQPVDQTPQERKLLLLLTLLKDVESFKIQALAMHLGVSISTLTTYLDELTEWLGNFDLQLTRKRGVGVEFHGNEENKRKALASYFLLYFSEELIESLFLLEKEKASQDKILHYFNPDYLLEIDRTVNDPFIYRHSQLADSDYIGLIVQIYITIQRLQAGFYLETGGEYEKASEEYLLMEKICNRLENTLSVRFTDADRSFLTAILKGSKLQAVETVSYDSILLGQMIKNMIQYVSTQLHVDLTKDFSLFQGLLSHMEPSIFRIKQKMRLFNPLTDEIKRKYPVLFLTVKNSVEKEFKDIDHFPEDEIAFIVLHFGSALVMREEEMNIQALVVCPTGIGTSKMLASRIKKEIAEIDSVEIKSIKEIQRLESLNKFDIILSTVRLPFIRSEYILVNPLLSDDDIKVIRSFLQKNIGNFTKDKKYQIKTEPKVSRKTQPTLKGMLQELKDMEQGIEWIIQHFRVYRNLRLNGYEETIIEMLRIAERESLISNANDVMETLKDRERKGGLGIPGTGMALFHCRSENVHGLIFQIAHLDKPFFVKGMDGNEMLMKNLLLMLAPENLSAREQEIISLLSTSLIETNESIMIFSSANEAAIRSKLESIFLEYLQTNIVKE
ncbi:PRD domain-containing protein [Bacillus sp. FJAT-49736]|uniref:BglG family transcription antiterminator n=1 Tax=Bacillus sp. FJAT-49736 TaxID=2833582 RepID=UPI001BC9D2EC|nr:PRD domain-containing protein [Bacillus sp. FJAT-49736]MBS4175561.1 BglG family transcription antiterminator [Bacillus sp. FJAT-49736]